MNIIKFLESLTDDHLYTSTGDRRQSFRQFGKIGKNLAIASVPFGLATFSNKLFAQDVAPTPDSPLGALQFALTLERLESAFYQAGLATPGLIPATGRIRASIEKIAQHETSHVNFLISGITNTFGAAAVPAVPTFDFTGTNPAAPGAGVNALGSLDNFLLVAQAFEDTGVRAYKGQAVNLMSNDTLLTYGLQIHSMEARHASELRRIRATRGWITGNAGGGLPAPPAPVYAGEDNVIQGGIDVSDIDNGTNGPAIPARGASEAFDEPLNTADTLTIANLFIV